MSVPAFVARPDADGKPAVFYHGTFQLPATCRSVLAEFRRIAEEEDWFAPMAGERAEQLSAAMIEAGGAYAEAAR